MRALQVVLVGCLVLCVAPSLGAVPGVGAAGAATKVGLVFDVGGRGDLSFNDMAYSGLERAVKTYSSRLMTKYLEPTAGGQNREELLRLLAEGKYDLIIGVGFLFTDSVTKVAKDFPAAKFAIVDGCPDTAVANVACLLFKEQEGSFLIGALAGMFTKTNKAGFVGGMKIPLIERFEAGYTAGAKYVNPKVTVYVDYAGTTGEAFKDPVKGKELALAQYDRSADVIYHASGATGIGVFEAAVARNKTAIGVDADQSLTVQATQRPHILSSMTKRVDVAVFDTIQALLNGSWKPGPQVFGLKEGGVGYAVNQYNKARLSAFVPKLEALKKDIIAGKIKVPATKQELQTFLQSLGRK
jgi:basic membrane protein A and related proteins